MPADRLPRCEGRLCTIVGSRCAADDVVKMYGNLNQWTAPSRLRKNAGLRFTKTSNTVVVDLRRYHKLAVSNDVVFATFLFLCSPCLKIFWYFFHWNSAIRRSSRNQSALVQRSWLYKLNKLIQMEVKLLLNNKQRPTLNKESKVLYGQDQKQ